MTSLGSIPTWFVITVFAIIFPELSNIVDLKFYLSISSFFSIFLKLPIYMAFEEKIIDIIKNTKKIKATLLNEMIKLDLGFWYENSLSYSSKTKLELLLFFGIFN